MDSLENPITAALNIEECIAEVLSYKIQTLRTDTLCAKQEKGINCINLAAQSHHKNRNSSNLVMISADGLLQKEQYILGLKSVVVAPYSVIPTILHEFHNSKGHQGTILPLKQ